MQEPFPQPQPLTTIKTKPGSFPCFKAFQTCSPERDLNYISNKNFITSWCVCVCDITSLDIQTKFGVGWGNPTARAGQMGFIPGSGRSPEEKRGNPFQYSCPENPMDREAWQATVHRVAKNWTQLKWLSMQVSTHTYILKWPSKRSEGWKEGRKGWGTKRCERFKDPSKFPKLLSGTRHLTPHLRFFFTLHTLSFLWV